MPIHYLKPKCKFCRREGMSLHLKGDRCASGKCAFARRPYPPGQHGPTQRRPKQSVYGTQLREKQKAKRMYGMTERQFARYVDMANRKTGDTSVFLRQMLESRLDNAVYRLGLASSRSEARQRVSHGHIMVNDKVVDVPSYQVRVGEEIRISSKPAFAPAVAERVKNHQAPSWLATLPETLSGKVVSAPEAMDFDTAFDAKLIIEFYSR